MIQIPKKTYSKQLIKHGNQEKHITLSAHLLTQLTMKFNRNKLTTGKRYLNQTPPWITEEVKKICHKKAKIYEKYVKNDRSDVDKDELVRVTSLTSDAIIKAKEKYFHYLGDKLNDPQTYVKSYWSILNKFLKKKRIPLIPPILSNGTFITNVCEKVMLFNSFFANQCTLINNTSTLPPFECKVNSKIDNVIFIEHDILSIIRSLNSNKAHGWDDISIRMVKMCDESIAYPLKIIF